MRHFPWGANKIFISFMHSLVSKMLCEEEWQVESLLSIFWQIYCYLKILDIICQGQRIHCRYKSTSKSLRCDIFRLIWSKTSTDSWFYVHLYSQLVCVQLYSNILYTFCTCTVSWFCVYLYSKLVLCTLVHCTVNWLCIHFSIYQALI